MKYTVAALRKSQPKSKLTNELMYLHPRKEVFLLSGQDTPNNKNSKLYKAMKETGWKNYVVGGRAGRNRTEGYHIAVYR